jgi:uncharacterized membrane protein (DUF485 family)
MSAEEALIEIAAMRDAPAGVAHADPGRAGPGLGDAGLRAVAVRHRRVSLTLAAVLMGAYLALMLLVAFARPLLGTLLAPGLSLGLVLGAAMIVFSWLLACGYVFWANRFHDAACRRLA